MTGEPSICSCCFRRYSCRALRFGTCITTIFFYFCESIFRAAARGEHKQRRHIPKPLRKPSLEDSPCHEGRILGMTSKASSSIAEHKPQVQQSVAAGPRG